MKLLKGTYYNFGSYNFLEFDFSNLGLSLISGQTGSGKSTVMDMVSWVLFGTTSKDGSVDEVRKWGGSDVTVGNQTVELPNGTITVNRFRGSPTQNDLYWVEDKDPDTKIRGKDVNETQKNLEARLGVSSELYFTSSYLHQFSRADSFFIAKAKDRRDVLERISDLSLPVKIADAASANKKGAKQERDELKEIASSTEGEISVYAKSEKDLSVFQAEWEEKISEFIKTAKENSEKFEETKKAKLLELEDKGKEALKDFVPDSTILEMIEGNKKSRQELEDLRPRYYEAKKALDTITYDMAALEKESQKHSNPKSEICPTCLGNSKNANRTNYLAEIDKKTQVLLEERTPIQEKVSSYEDLLGALPALTREFDFLTKQRRENDAKHAKYKAYKTEHASLQESVNTQEIELRSLQSQTNPYSSQLETVKANLSTAKKDLKLLNESISNLDTRISALTQLYDLSFDLRGKLLEKSVQEVEASTNTYLEKYFDGEIRVEFKLNSDKIDVLIQKNGYTCSFKQLSGGQRCILKLAFSISLMVAAANNAGVHFDNLFFDESLNGLDDTLKVKAFSLFQELENTHGTILLIDHAEEFKSMFSNQFKVEMEADSSTISHIAGTDEQ